MARFRVIWVGKWLRPAEGWLAFLLLWVVVLCLMGAVVEARWTPEAGVAAPAALLGFAVGVLLARRSLPAWQAWTLLLLYGLLLCTVYLARLLPPWRILLGAWSGYAQFNQEQTALFVDRVAGWLRAALSGGSSRETVVFAFGLGLLVWLLAAHVGWSAFRQRQPVSGLMMVGLALAINGYFGAAPIWYAVVFVAAAALLLAVLHYAYLEQDWDAHQISYPTDIQVELVMAAGAVAAILMVLAMAVPTIRLQDVAQAFRAQPVVQQTEETLERVFAGIRSPRQEAAAFSGAGILPNDFLLGNPPELANTVVMTATVSLTSRGNPDALAGLHWRGLSYDVYNGQGWELSTGRQEEVMAGVPIPLPPISQAATITQTVHGLFTAPCVHCPRYTLGLPRQFDQAVTVFWRGVDDLAQVRAAGSPRYTAISTASAAGETAWRQATLDGIPPLIRGRYTQLPDALPERVRALAQAITAPYDAPYDQARAIEAFLRQYPYNLDVALPPDGRDAVDFFLFDLQQGYCDYYASAMTVLARSIGLPARLAVGYLAQPPDAAGVQTIVQLNAHAWAEVYFAGYGWLEFEPTSPFPLRQTVSGGIDGPPEFADDAAPINAPPLPTADRRIPYGWYAAGLLLCLLLAAFWARRRAVAPLDGVQSAYARLQGQAQKLGLPLPDSQTPLEFAAAFTAHVAQLSIWLPLRAGGSRQTHWREMVKMGATRLAELFMRRQYAPPPARAAADAAAPGVWRETRRSLWLLRLFKRKKRTNQ